MHLLSMSVDAMHSLNMRDLYGNTPMHYWALRGEAASGILSQLEELGGDFSCVNESSPGDTALRRGQRRGNLQGAGYGDWGALLLLATDDHGS